jgi:hypothetical protein
MTVMAGMKRLQQLCCDLIPALTAVPPLACSHHVFELFCCGVVSTLAGVPAADAAAAAANKHGIELIHSRNMRRSQVLA